MVLSANFWMVLSLSGGTPMICVIASVFFRKTSKMFLTWFASYRETELAAMSLLFVKDTGMI